MLAVVKIQGHQFIVKPQDKLIVDRIDKPENESIQLDKILLLKDDNGNVSLGTPYVSEVSISVKILRHFKGDKVRVFKMKAKKRYSINRGFRPYLTEIQIEKIEFGMAEEPVVQKVEEPAVQKAEESVDSVEPQKAKKTTSKRQRKKKAEVESPKQMELV